jgi:hypothetical protein
MAHARLDAQFKSDVARIRANARNDAARASIERAAEAERHARRVAKAKAVSAPAVVVLTALGGLALGWRRRTKTHT